MKRTTLANQVSTSFFVVDRNLQTIESGMMVFGSYFKFLNDLCFYEKKRAVHGMPPSKLDKYLKILEVLVRRPQEVDHVAYRAKMECRAVKRCLDFLVLNGLVEKRKLSGKRAVYAINERGLSVFKTLRMLKYLEKLKKTLPLVEEAREIAPVLSKHFQKWRE